MSEELKQPTQGYKYLTYSIDKHQSSPAFRNDFPDSLKADCDDGFDVVVDLQTFKRYFLGEWKDVDASPLSEVREGSEK